MTREVFVELATGRHDQFVEAGWEVEAGSARRGDAHCDFRERRLRVPLGGSASERSIRAHELLHRRVSPHDLAWRDLGGGVSARALECAEEFRVNLLLERLGFDASALADGSEQHAGTVLAAADDWAEAVNFYAALLGTGGERSFVKGVRATRPEWVKPLSVVKKHIDDVVRSLGTATIASTERDPQGDQMPEGFRVVTLRVAQVLARAAGAQVPRTPDELSRFRRSLAPGGRRPPSGRFANLVMAPNTMVERGCATTFARRSRAAATGTRVGSVTRLLTDPQQRVFRTSRPVAGGVVLVDQSGSMDLASEAIDDLVRRVPGVTILGYSHRPGDASGHPNAWLLASDGLRATSIPSGNVGNGVDGPVLRWAVARRRGNERILWVTDGQVTGSNDHPSDALSQDCADLVRRHRIELVSTLDEAVRALVSRRRVALRPLQFGRVGRRLAA